MFKTKGTYVFDSLGAEHFHAYFNDCILRYGTISVGDLFTDPLLLGLDDKYLVRNEADTDEFTKISYFTVGWQDELPMTKMFKVEEKHGKFIYILNLPRCVPL